MNKLIIFDLDGVLIESRELHYEALNSALTRVSPQFIISREEHAAAATVQKISTCVNGAICFQLTIKISFKTI